MNTFTKALVGTIAAGAMVVPAVTPALARDGRGRDGVSAGDVIAGALIIGGIAAIATAASRDNNRNRGYDYDRAGYDDRGWGDRDRGRGYDNRYGYGSNYGNPREAVEMCVRAAQQTASRYSYGRAQVTDVRDIDRNDRGYTVRGRIAVNTMGHDWRNNDSHYGRGWNNDYRGWNDGMRGYDSGSFRCRVEYGRVVDVDFGGIRGL